MRRIWLIFVALLSVMPHPGFGQPAAMRDRIVVASDGTRLHLIEAGPPGAHTILFVPGWTMPAWIWDQQIRFFSRGYRVIAFDPRGQGASDVPASGYDHVRRSRDIAEVIAAVGSGPLVVVAWSLGVLETLAFINTYGDRSLAGLVLVDNSVGEEPAPTASRSPPRKGPKPPHAEAMRRFVQGMFAQKQPAAYVDRLTRATLRMPEQSARALLSFSVPRTYWREGVYATTRPVLYVVRPRWAAQASNLARNRAGTETEIFYDAGHALFVDESERFNRLVADFIRRRVWP
ncbi:MAG: alpha/beta fold hydrolase [Acetobacteraceae bacterium]